MGVERLLDVVRKTPKRHRIGRIIDLGAAMRGDGENRPRLGEVMGSGKAAFQDLGPVGTETARWCSTTSGHPSRRTLRPQRAPEAANLGRSFFPPRLRPSYCLPSIQAYRRFSDARPRLPPPSSVENAHAPGKIRSRRHLFLAVTRKKVTVAFDGSRTSPSRGVSFTFQVRRSHRRSAT